MSRVEEMQSGRNVLGQEAVMQKLFVKGHLLTGADLSAKHINNFLLGLGEVCGMNIFDGPHVKTPDSYDSDTYRRLRNKAPEDINGSVMWDDSGAQIYIFPNKGNWFTLDTYTCKKFDPEAALIYTYEELGIREDMMYSTSTSKVNTGWEPFILPDGKSLNPEARYLPEIDNLFDMDSVDSIKTGLILRRVMEGATREGCGKRVADKLYLFTNQRAAGYTWTV